MNEGWTVACLRLPPGAIREMEVVWKKGHGVGPQKKQPQLYLRMVRKQPPGLA